VNALEQARHIAASSGGALHRAQHDLYLRGLFWILRERAGGGWPPRDIDKVSGWKVVRMLAALTNHPVRTVARELIDTALKMEGSDE
jgi:hypothetical protein